MRMLIYRWKERLKRFLPVGVKKWVLHRLGWHISRNRRETNGWLRDHAAAITGDVISLGSGSDLDKEGRHYRDYFARAASYTTADLSPERGADCRSTSGRCRRLPTRRMMRCVCNSVLEHVDDYKSGAGGDHAHPQAGRNSAAERAVPSGVAPGALRLLALYVARPALPARTGLRDRALDEIDLSVPKFPASYWVEARKR